MADINVALNWMHARRAEGMRYSMDFRNSASYSDCSSAVFRALRHAGFPVPYIGNTESMFQWRGTLFTTISRADIRAGDVFVSGVPGGSANAYGHAGFALNATQAIHSSSRFNGIGVSSNADSAVAAYGGAPVYWLRVVGSTGSNPTPTPDPETPEEELIYLDDEFVEHEYLTSIFGTKVETWELDDIDSQADLKQKALDQMDAQLDKYHETTANVLELGLLDDQLDLVELGNRHVLHTNGRLMASGSQRIIRQDLNLLEPTKSNVTFGVKYSTLVDLIVDRPSKFKSMVRDLEPVTPIEPEEPVEPEIPIEPEPDPTPEEPEEPVESEFDGARVVNLADYGGSSGNTDNFNAIKSAVNASATEPLILEIDAGTYNLEGATNDRIQMEPWETAKSKGLRLVGKGDVVFKHKHNRTVNKHEYYFMQLVMSEDSLGFEMENITVDGIRNPQEELFYTQTESNPVPNIPLTRGIATTGAHNVQYKNVTFKNMYGGYSIQMSEYRDVSIKDVNFDKVGGNDIQESFGMAIYLGGHSGDAIVNIDNAHAQGMTTTKELKLSWIGVVLENGSIQSSNPSAWMRDKNTTVNITNSSFMDYQSTFHVESMAGNVYWNVDDVTARGSNYQIVAGVYGEYKESSNNVKMDMMPYGRLWGIVHGLWYTEAQETADNISGHNKMDMYNSVINLKTLPGFGNIPQAVAYGNSVKGYLHNTQLNDVPYKLVQNGSAYLYDSVINLAQGSSETRASLQTGMFGTGDQMVELNNTTVNIYANKQNVVFGSKPNFVGNTGFVAPHISLPISPPL